MDRNSMDTQSGNQHVSHNTNNQQPLTIYSNVSRSNEIQYCYERPMMLNTWTQTSNADLGITDDYVQNIYTEEYKKREKVLVQIIHDLETKLRIQSDILSQSSSGSRRNSDSHNTRSPREVIINQIPVQMHENHPHNKTTTHFQVYNTQISPSNVHCEQLSQMKKSPQQGPEPQNANVAIQNQDEHAVTNTIQSARPRKVNYTIIADGSVNGHDGPIEIEIAEEENTLNLNGSADSERLEICLEEEQSQPAANVNYIKYVNDGEQNLSKDIPQQNFVTPCSRGQRFKISTENISQYPIQNNCGSPEATPTFSHYSNSSSALASSPAVTQYPDSQNCEMSMAAKANCSKSRANGGIIKKNGHQGGVLTQSDLKNNSFTSIGPNNTLVPNKVFDNINWDIPSIATRKLLMALFDRKTLATHSMTGKPSPAFKDKNIPLKKKLNPLITQDIIFAVSRRCRVSEKDVRNSITTKCADENKMWKLAQAKLKRCSEQNKENVS